MTFDRGVVSHLKLRSHFSKIDWAGSITEPLNEKIPSGLSEQVFPREHDNNEQLDIETESASGWLWQEDVIQIIGTSIGFCLFLLVVMGIVYLKCKRKRGSSVMVPYFSSETQSVNLSRGGFGQHPSYTQFSQPHPDIPTGPAASAETTPNSTASAPPLDTNKSLERRIKQQQSPKHSTRRGKHSIVSGSFRTK